MKTPQQWSRLRLLAAGATLATTALVVLPAGSASAADAGDQPFSGWVRNYSAYVGAELLNGAVNARVNIGEAIAVADSTGLNKTGYVGTSTGDLAVPGQLAADPTSRSYARSAPVGAGLIGLNVQPMKTESVSTTVVDGDLETLETPLSMLDLSPLGKLSLLAGLSDSNWNSTVLTNGGRLAYADSSIGTLELLNSGIPGLNIPIPIPGFDSLFPLGQAELGQNTSEVKLVGDTTACPTGLAVQSRASWDFADVHLLDSFIDISWGGNAGGGTPDSAVMTATANGLPAGAKIVVPELGDMTVNIGTLNLTLKPGLSLEVGKILRDAGGLGSTLATFIDGEISYEGVTDIHEAADGTWAHGAVNGLEANLSLLPVPIIAPNGLGAVELGVMRGEVDAVAPAGGLNCPIAPGTTTTGTTTTGTTTTGTTDTGVTTTGATTTGTTDTGVTTTGTPVTGVTTTGTTDTGVTTTGTTDTGVTTTGTPVTGVTTTGTTDTGVSTTGTTDTGVTTTGTPVTGVTTTGTTDTGVTTTGATTTSTSVEGTTITGTTSVGVTTTGTTDTGVTTTGATTTGTTDTGVTTTGTPVTGVTTTGTPVTGVTTTGTTDTGVTTTGATTTSTSVEGTTITGTTSVGVTTTGTPVTGVTTTGTPVTGVTTTGTPVTGVTTTGTTDTGVTTTGVTTTGTPVTGVTTTGATDTGVTTTGATDTGATTTGATDTGTTVVAPPVGVTTAGASTSGASTNGGVLPNTGGVPIQLIALGMGLLLVGGRLLGASRYWRRSSASH